MKRFYTFLITLFIIGSHITAQQVSTDPIVRMETTKGDIILKLFPNETPETVANFLQYVNDGYYEGTIFHRVIDGLLIQGGGFTEGFLPKPMRAPIKNESHLARKNIRGTIGLAQTTDANSGAAQFYINLADNEHLDHNPKRRRPGFTVFGEVIEGMDIVNRIRKVRTHKISVYSKFYDQEVPIKDVPEKDIVIKKVTVLR